MTTTPIHHWTMDSVNAGPPFTVNDAIVGGMSLSAANWSQVSGWDGYAISQPDTTYPLSLASDQPFKAVSLWLKRINTDNYGVFGCTAAGNKLLVIRPNGEGGKLYFYHGTGPSDSNLSISDTDWHHVWIVEGSSSNHHWFWLDGVKASTELLSNLGGVLKFFSRPGFASGQENMVVDNIQWYDRIPTDDEIAYLAAATSQESTLPIAYTAQIIATIEQPYGDVPTYCTLLPQPYSLRLLAQLLQEYDDAPTFRLLCHQYYDSSRQLSLALLQLYVDAARAFSSLSSKYSVSDVIEKISAQPYSVVKGSVRQTTVSLYRVSSNTEVISSLPQVYSVVSDSREVTDVSTLTIGGRVTRMLSGDLKYSLSSYTARCNLSLAYQEDWDNTAELSEVILHINGVDHHLIVLTKTYSESAEEVSFHLELASPAVLLDFPYAREVSGTFQVSGTMSQVVNSIAALEGFSVVWEIPVDSVLTSDNLQVEGKSPLECIRAVVNELGGRIQSRPDGSIHAVRHYKVDSDKYSSAIPFAHYSVGFDMISVNGQSDKRDGYNKYSVTNVSQSQGWSLDPQQVNDSTYQVKARKVPWSSASPTLTTSELTNISISAIQGPVFEELEEEVEILAGAGRVSKPHYGTISVDYKTSTDLGDLTFNEDGSFTSETPGYSIVTVKYNTKYWTWRATNTDSENVQLILEA